MGGTLFASFPKFPPTQPAAATSPTLHMRRPLVCQLSYLGLEVALEPLGKYGRSPYFTLRALESADRSKPIEASTTVKRPRVPKEDLV